MDSLSMKDSTVNYFLTRSVHVCLDGVNEFSTHIFAKFKTSIARFYLKRTRSLSPPIFGVDVGVMSKFSTHDTRMYTVGQIYDWFIYCLRDDDELTIRFYWSMRMISYKEFDVIRSSSVSKMLRTWSLPSIEIQGYSLLLEYMNNILTILTVNLKGMVDIQDVLKLIALYAMDDLGYVSGIPELVNNLSHGGDVFSKFQTEYTIYNSPQRYFPSLPSSSIADYIGDYFPEMIIYFPGFKNGITSYIHYYGIRQLSNWETNDRAIQRNDNQNSNNERYDYY